MNIKQTKKKNKKLYIEMKLNEFIIITKVGLSASAKFGKYLVVILIDFF